MLRLSESVFIAVTMEALLFGASMLMFILTLWILLRKRNSQRPSCLFILSACALQTLAIAELIANIVRAYEGLGLVGQQTPDATDLYFANFTRAMFIVKIILYNIQTLIFDGVLIYRAYVVWQKLYVVVVPTIGWFGLAAATVGTNHALATATGNKTDIFIGTTGKWIIGLYSITLGTNLSASTLLAYRVWKVDHGSRKYKSNNILGPVLLAIIESGAIYSVIIIAALVCHLIRTPAAFILLDMISPTMCIVFNMIIVRIALTSSTLLPSIVHSGHPETSIAQSHPEGRRRARGHDGDAFQLTSLSVEVTRHVEMHVDADSISEADRKVDRNVEHIVDIAPSKASSGISVCSF